MWSDSATARATLTEEGDRLDIEISDPERSVITDNTDTVDTGDGPTVPAEDSGGESGVEGVACRHDDRTETDESSSNNMTSEVKGCGSHDVQPKGVCSEGTTASKTTRETSCDTSLDTKDSPSKELEGCVLVQGASTKGDHARDSEASTVALEGKKDSPNFTTSENIKLSNKLLYSMD